MSKRTVLIYRNELLPPSETFIRAQAGMLQKFTPVFAGLKQVQGSLDLGSSRILTLSNSESWSWRLRRRVFLRTGRSEALLKAIAAQRPELAHAHFAIDAGAVLPVAMRLGIPLVVTLHGYDVTCSVVMMKSWPTMRAYLRRRASLMDYAAVFFCVSEHVRRQALALGFPESKLYVHHIGVDLKEPENSLPPRDKNIVLFAGRLIEKKGCSYLIRAMSLVKQVSPQAMLVVIGDGPLRKTLEMEATRRDINAVFLGYMENEVVRQWMRMAQVLVAPSIRAESGDSDGLPTVLCEAQSEGLPVIAFATDGVTEAFSTERRKILPVEKDVAGLAEQILVLLNDEAAWQKASDAGRQWMRSYFDLRVQTGILEDKYEELIEEHRA